MKMTNKTYDVLKKVALLIAPLITFLAAIGDIWGIPYNVEITATLAAIDTLLGSILTISTMNYNKEQNEVAGDIEEGKENELD